jgi:hypothetical protein
MEHLQQLAESDSLLRSPNLLILILLLVLLAELLILEKDWINASKHLKSIYKEADKAQKELDKAKRDFVNDEKTYNEYITKTAERNISEYKNEMRKRRDDAKPSKAEMDEYISGVRAYYKNGKGEFAEAAAWENYVSDHKDAQDLKDRAEKSYGDFRRACRNTTNELLQEYSKVPVNYTIAGYKMKHTADLLVTDALIELAKIGK